MFVWIQRLGRLVIDVGTELVSDDCCQLLPLLMMAVEH